jgi:nicotinate-nucleotide adenylyltransferase
MVVPGCLESETAMKRLCFGGSFNPIHHGHLICARAVAEQGGFDQVVLIPSAQPPHKPADTNLAAPIDRLAMCQLAVSGDPLFTIDDIELLRPGPSYTIETVRQFRQNGWPQVNWLIGADMAVYLPHWHETGSLLREVQFILMARPGWTLDLQAMPPEFRHLQQQIVPAPLIDISSTDIRRRLAAGQSIRYMTPPAVADYIAEKGLYSATNVASKRHPS